jgi:hypothetical protein
LDFSSCDLMDIDIESFTSEVNRHSSGRSLSHLKEFDLADNLISGLAFILSPIKNHRLEFCSLCRIFLSFNRFRPRVAPQICEVIDSLPTLQELDLADNLLADGIVMIVSHIKTGLALRGTMRRSKSFSLDVSWNGFTVANRLSLLVGDAPSSVPDPRLLQNRDAVEYGSMRRDIGLCFPLSLSEPSSREIAHSDAFPLVGSPRAVISTSLGRQERLISGLSVYFNRPSKLVTRLTCSP